MDNRLALPLHCVSLIILCGAAPSSQPAQRPLTRPSEDQSRRLVVVQSLAQEYAAKIATAEQICAEAEISARIRAESSSFVQEAKRAMDHALHNTDADEAYETAAKRVTDAERAKEHALYEGYDKYLAAVHRYDNAKRDMESALYNKLQQPDYLATKKRYEEALAQAMKTDLELQRATETKTNALMLFKAITAAEQQLLAEMGMRVPSSQEHKDAPTSRQSEKSGE